MAIDPEAGTDALLIPKPGKDTPLHVVLWSGQRDFKTTSGTSQLIVLPVGSKIIEITAVENVYVEFGGSGAVAEAVIADDLSRLLLKGIQVIPVPLDPATGLEYTHVAVIQSTVAGIFQVEQVS